MTNLETMASVAPPGIVAYHQLVEKLIAGL